MIGFVVARFNAVMGSEEGMGGGGVVLVGFS